MAEDSKEGDACGASRGSELVTYTLDKKAFVRPGHRQLSVMEAHQLRQGAIEDVPRVGGDAKGGMNGMDKGKVDKMPSVVVFSADSPAMPHMGAELVDTQFVLGMQLRAIVPLAANDVSEFLFAADGHAIIESRTKQYFVYREHLLAKFERV